MPNGKQKIIQLVSGFDKLTQQVAQLPKETRAELFKSSVIYKIKGKAKESAFQHFTSHTLSNEDKSLISLFIISAKTANTAILKNFEFQPVDKTAYGFLHNQLFTEMELITKLQHLTPWTTDWETYSKGTEFNLKLWQKAEIIKYSVGFFQVDRHLYEYLALSYALLSEINFMSVVSMKNIESDAYVQMLHDLESENSKMIQTQLRLLKDIEVPLTRPEREEIVEGKRKIVQQLFDEFLTVLCTRPAKGTAPN